MPDVAELGGEGGVVKLESRRLAAAVVPGSGALTR